MKSKTYEEFVEKFKPKLTTDDCYTPEPVYEVVVKYCEERYHITRDQIIRPFYPGGDYEAEDYTGRVVIDNPPFSILSKIVNFYDDKCIPFFLFAPTLTMFSTARRDDVCCIAVGAAVIYENGASVNTSFITNMEPDTQCRSDPELYQEITRIVKEYRKETVKQLPRYEMPDNIITAAKLAYFSKNGVDLKIRSSRSRYTRSLKSMRDKGKMIYGGAFILSENTAAEKAAAEKAAAIFWPLSDEEKELTAALDKSEKL